MNTVLEEIGAEIKRAKAQWGQDFDDKNTLNDWVTYVDIYLGKAAAMGATPDEIRRNLRKAAGLAVSAFIQFTNKGFAPRHYEKQARPKSLPEIGEKS